MRFFKELIVALIACLSLTHQSNVCSNETENVTQNDHSEQASYTAPNDYSDTFQNVLPFSNPLHLQDTFPFDYYITYKMAEWGFEYFQIACKYLLNDKLISSLNKNFFSYQDYYLLCDLLEEKIVNFSKEKLIRLLEIGQQYLPSKEIEKKIIDVVALAIFERKFNVSLLEQFPAFQQQILKTSNAFDHHSISIEDGILQLNCSKITRIESEVIVKYFLMRAKRFEFFHFYSINFTHEIIKRIGEQVRNALIVFYTPDWTVTVSSEDFEVVYEKLKKSRKLNLMVMNSKSILAVFDAVPENRLIRFNIFCFREDWLADPNFTLTEIFKCKQVKTKGDLDEKFFENIYFKIKESISDIIIRQVSRMKSFINLFTSPSTLTHHDKLFPQKQNNWMKNDFFVLNLTKISTSITQYEETDFSTKEFTRLFVSLDDGKYLDVLSKAFENTKIIEIDLIFYSSFTHFDKLLEIIEAKSFQSLIINPISELEEGKKFFDDLTKTSLWKGLKYLNIYKASSEIISRFLHFLPPNLEKLVLFFPEPINEQFDKNDANSKEKQRDLFFKEFELFRLVRFYRGIDSYQ